MKFHEIHIGQDFIPKGTTLTNTRVFTKTGRSTAISRADERDRHFAATDEVDGLQPNNKHPQSAPRYPVPASDHLGGMMVLGNAIAYLETTKRRNNNETSYQRWLYGLSTIQATDKLAAAFDELSSEHAIFSGTQKIKVKGFESNGYSRNRL